MNNKKSLDLHKKVRLDLFKYKKKQIFYGKIARILELLVGSIFIFIFGFLIGRG